MSDVSNTAPTLHNQLARAAILISVLGGCSWLDASGGSSSMESTANPPHTVVLIHLLAVSSWFGCSVWVTFVAGIVMFKTLPRHVFGRLQSRLFPAYFQFSTATLVIAIVTNRAIAAVSQSATPLLAILACTLLNLLYFEPATTKVMYQRHAVEKRLGTGHEIGKLKPDDPTKANDPQLKALSKTFGMLHGISSLLNLVALGCGCYWLNHCAHQMTTNNGGQL